MNFSAQLSDIPASFVVFLVALPLSMGVALASGVPPALGLVTAVVGGLTVGLLGGAPLQISGPSAGLTVLVLQTHREHGMEAFAIIVLFAGLMQLLAGAFKLGRHFQAVSPAVIRGMLAGIGTLIILGQFHVMLDVDVPGSGVDNLLAIPSVIWRTITQHDDLTHDEAALIGVMTLVIVFGWEKLKTERFRRLPGPLLGAIFAAVLAAILDLPIRYVAVPEHLEEVLAIPTWPAIAAAAVDSDILVAGLGLAFVATAETLLCAGAVARMHHGGRTDYDRELAAQGVGNVLVGLVGALPMSGVISRSTVNVEAGAKSKWSAILMALWIAAFVLFLPDLLGLVPTSSLAAILIYVGIKLINPKAIRALSRFGRGVMFVFVATVVGIVVIDLLKGIVIGLVLSAIRLMLQMSHVHFDLVKSEVPVDDGPAVERWDLHMHGSATYLGLGKMQDALGGVKPGVDLHLHFDDLDFIDHACLDLLSEFRARHEATGGSLSVEWDELFDRRQKKSVGAESASAASRD